MFRSLPIAALLSALLLTGCGSSPETATTTATAPPATGAKTTAPQTAAATDPSASVGSYAEATALPPYGALRKIAPGVEYAEVTLPRSGGPARKLWIYLPAGTPKTAKLPLVLVAPAGAPMWHGMALGDGDRPEQIPYARAGYAVLAYEFDGDLRPGDVSHEEMVESITAFRRAENGVLNAKDALRYARERLPVDPERIFAVGHSSAGTLALQVASREEGLAGCVAYMPVTDLMKRWGIEAPSLDGLLPGFTAYSARELSPTEVAGKIACPVFLYGAEDDPKIPPADLRAFAAKLKTAGNADATVGVSPDGGHYDAMIERGMPAALAWMAAHGGVKAE